MDTAPPGMFADRVVQWSGSRQRQGRHGRRRSGRVLAGFYFGARHAVV
jgi:hypothetical protein